MYTSNYQQHSNQANAYSSLQTENHFMHDPCIMCHHSSKHQSILSTVANALFNYYLFPQAYVYVVSAPILTSNNTTVINPETSNRQDTHKANANAKQQLSPVYKTTNNLKDLIEKINNELFQFEKSPVILAAAKKVAAEANYLTTQTPGNHDHGAIAAYSTAVDVLQNEFVQLKNQMHEFEINLATNRKEALSSVRESNNALTTSFAELEKNYDLHGELKAIFTSRHEFWNRYEKLIESTEDFKQFNFEKEKQMVFDFFLLSFLEDEITQAIENKVAIQSHLGILSTMTDENFTKKVISATKKFDMAPFSGMQIQALKTAIIDIMLMVEKEETTTFLDSLSNIQKEFASYGYMTVAEHYSETIAQFEEVAKLLSLESIDAYIDLWNDLLIEFDPQHQHLLKLKEAEKNLQAFSEQTLEWLSNNILEEKFYGVLDKLNDLSTFRYQKNELKDAADIETYINTINAFMDVVKKELMNLSA